MIISVFNQKGGVGKTTTSVNLALGLAELDKKVLVIDLDPQGDATLALNVNEDDIDKNTVYEMLFGERTINECILPSLIGSVDVIPAVHYLEDAEIELWQKSDSESILVERLGYIKGKYDYIIIDCRPSLALLSINALVASDGLIVPIYPSYFSVKGFTLLYDMIRTIKRSANQELTFMGILITNQDRRKNITQDIERQLRDELKDEVFEVVIRTNSKIEEVQNNGENIFKSYKGSNGAIDYLELAKEVISKSE